MTWAQLILIAMLAADAVWMIRILQRYRAIKRITEELKHDCAKLLRDLALKLERGGGKAELIPPSSQMATRWAKAKPASPQLPLMLPRGLWTPPVKPQTDTAIDSAEALGMHRSGDLAHAMIPILEKRAARAALGGVMLAIQIRNEVYDYLVAHPEGATADEIAQALLRSAFTVRPRVSELYHSNKIADSGARRKNASGRSAIVWRVKEDETSED